MHVLMIFQIRSQLGVFQGAFNHRLISTFASYLSTAHFLGLVFKSTFTFGFFSFLYG